MFRCLPCKSPCCSYACATLPPSSIPVDVSLCASKKTKKKKKGKGLKGIQNMSPSRIALLSKSDLEMMTPSQFLLLSPSKQELIMKKMQDAGISMNKFTEAGIDVDKLKSNYAGSEGGYLTRKCDPRCKAKRNRPATASGAPSNNTTAYCDVGGVHRSDATTTTDIKTNAATSTNNLDFFHCAQKAANQNILDNVCCNPECIRAIQQQYSQALQQQQWLQRCYYCQVMAQQNPFGLGTQLPRTSIGQNALSTQNQSIAQFQNVFRPSIYPSSSLFSGALSYPSNQSQIPSTALSWPSGLYPAQSAYFSRNIPFTGATCGTCGRFNPTK
ncbi:uncharacterized protein LOC123672592 [Harmonia axyridis]|uniref:uncharacterized protein LOC123672592 n=1 Tax=Harmonia axyridis TaxID=115357 RepID=UPI001E278F3A|nr:uncharacterized protein LOC123672592 [Harmonia axyridis]